MTALSGESTHRLLPAPAGLILARSFRRNIFGSFLFTHCLVLVADGARADLMEQLLREGRLPNIKQHVTDRGCYRTALTVFPSTTGPAHIPFVTGQHPGTANIPGYRWLSRATHDRKRRSIYRHRSLNSPRGLFLGRDMDAERTSSLYEYFNLPSSVLEPVDLCPNQRLDKLIARRLFYVARAHHTDDWGPVDRMVERRILERIDLGSECIIATFFGIDEYSHLYSPHDERTIAAYLNIDRAVGRIAERLKSTEIYDRTVIAIVSDHGLTATSVHIPLVDMVKQAGFDPYYYPKMYRSRHDSAVMESGNAMAQLYFRRGDQWGETWSSDELQSSPKIAALLDRILATTGVSFVAARTAGGGVTVIGQSGRLTARSDNGAFTITVEGDNPLGEHPVGRFSAEELFEETYYQTYPDAVNQLTMLFSSPRSGDIAVSSEPGFDLRWQHEDPEHHGSHGSLHREHMHVPLAISVPVAEEKVTTADVVPTILALTRRHPRCSMDGRRLTFTGRFEKYNRDDQNDAGNTAASPGANRRTGWVSAAITAGLIILSVAIASYFKADFLEFGTQLMKDYGQDRVDVILLLATAISSSPLALPIWGYALVGIALGYNVYHLAVVMALGSALGSLVTFLLGRFFGQSDYVRRKFPSVHRHPWAEGRSRLVVSLLLFLGTASPIPCDIFYVACGAKRYPPALFLGNMVLARFVRYVYLGYAFLYFPSLFS